MIVTQNTKLNIVPGGIIPVVHVTQFDVDRPLSFTLYDGNSPADLESGTTVTIEGTKPDGHGFAYTGTLVDNIATFNTTEQMTVLSGSIECKLVLSLNSQVIGTAMFILDIEKAAIDGNTDMSDTEIPPIIELASQQESNAEAWANGTRGGEPTEPTDPTYHKDSRYWAEYAESAVTGVTGVKGNAEETYRRGNVNLTPSDIGALATDGDSKDCTVSFTSYDTATTEKTDDGTTKVYPEPSGAVVGALTIRGTIANISKIRIDNAEYTSYDNMPVKAGSIVTFFHDSTREWGYDPISGDQVILGTDEACYFTVPNDATGAAVLAIYNTMEPSPPPHSWDQLFFDDYQTTGWVKTNIIPVLGETQPTSDPTLTTGEQHKSLFNKISAMFSNIRKLWNTVGTTALESGKTVTELLGSTQFDTGAGQTITAAVDTLVKRRNVDYASGTGIIAVSKSAGQSYSYTAPNDGVVSVYQYTASSSGCYGSWKVNEHFVTSTYGSNTCGGNSVMLVKKGDIVKYTPSVSRDYNIQLSFNPYGS